VRLGGDGHEHGQIVPLVAVVLLVAAAGVVVVGRLAASAAALAATQAVADAVALAGAQAGEATAAGVAAANRARLVRFEQAGDLVQVEVSRGPTSAVATAQIWVEPGGTPSVEGEPPGRDPLS
jgi:hypothetical protein